MADGTFAGTPQKNKAGGLNMNWAARQALDKLGVEATVAEVKAFIEREYGRLGRAAVEKQRSGTLGTAVWVMRKKLKLELASAAPVKTEVKVPAPFTLRRLTPEPVAAVPAKEEAISPASELLRMQEYILKTLKPAMSVIEAAGGVQVWPRLEALVKACEVG